MSIAVLPIWLFLGSLFVAPQLWWGPLRDLRVDYIVYPAWMLVLMIRGRFGTIFSFQTQDKFFLWMLVWILMSCLTNGYTEVGQFYLIYYLKLLLVYRLTCASISDATDLRRTGYAVLALVLLIAIEGIQHKNNPDGLGWAGQSYAWIDAEEAAKIGLVSRIRWVGIFDGPGVFCAMFTLAAPFAFQYLVKPYSKMTRLLVAAGIAAPILLAVFYTGSRGGILATAAMSFMFVVSRFKVNLKKLVLAAAVGGLILMAMPSYLTETKDSNHSAQGRVDMWAFGMQMVERNPVFGIGKGNYAIYTGRLIAHNSALEIMGETGFGGMFLWISIIFMGFKQLAFRIGETTDEQERQTLLAVMMSLAGYLVSSLFVTLESETMYFLLGLTAAVGRMTSQPVAFTRRDALIVFAIMMTYYLSFKLFVMSYY